ncbi:ribose 5-phosphate isomerase A [Monoraphidium neglectum]|uniref:ribose-5-phosphate isomerase n=1 Tax=Monoraphidium neglectum TaxID=145388 RepID=A0A0D2LN67_9CHLO|nr:ribose 5-phosphate isomerase A [Monoraphidium neglectum]KIY93239.1 ribose 5-phosphate isomerase A [Monoraphidium neglectum]|eukprot:XP_013892259.1 ribose 5-phosphate isomerase A [Monoraphidium neglectum]
MASLTAGRTAFTASSAFRPERRSVVVRAMATQLSQDELKKQAAWKAVDYVKSGMVVGLGTGSTAAFAVDRIGQLLKDGTLKDIIGAKSLGIPLATLDEQPKLDVAIDGADEVDPNLDVVKGRGGALLREKMVEKASAKFVCIVDDSKLVKGLGGSKLAMPVEIVQFCHK